MTRLRVIPLDTTNVVGMKLLPIVLDAAILEWAVDGSEYVSVGYNPTMVTAVQKTLQFTRVSIVQ